MRMNRVPSTRIEIGLATAERLNEAGRDIGQVAGAESSGEQADAVEHDAGGAAAIDDVLECGLAALPPALEKAGQGITRQAGHLDADEDHEQMIRRRHQRHADDGPQKEAIEIGGVLAVGNAGKQRQPDHQTL